MKPTEAKDALKQLCLRAKAVAEVAKTASRNNKSLSGDNFYGHKFHDATTAMASTHTKVTPLLARLTGAEAPDAVRTVAKFCETLKSPTATSGSRMTAMKGIEHAVNAVLLHAVDAMDSPSAPASEPVLLMSVVKGTRGYLEHMVLQANGCYEQGWFDASSVMIRKFIETLVIEVYEKAARANEIKNQRDNNFHMLSGLVDIILTDNTFNLARETKATLPLAKQLGDRSAHNRRYLAKRGDVDNIIPGLRVLADDLLHLAGLK